MKPTNRPAIMVLPTVLHLLDEEGPSAPVPVEFQYDLADPYAVALTFAAPHGPNSWIFARELLALGLVEGVGEGDIHVWPGITEQGQVLLIELSTNDGEAVLSARPSEVRAFLDKSFEMVAAGAEGEHCDVDALIASVLATEIGASDE
jgi:hypothetical protein